MDGKVRKKENEIQSAIMASLQHVCDAKGVKYRGTFFQNSQQGDGVNKISADFVCTLNSGHFFMFEVKVLNENTMELMAWDQDQYLGNLYFEKQGCPIFYVYNSVVELCYHRRNNIQDTDCSSNTLKEVKISKPSRLKSIKPLIEMHETMYDFFQHSGTSSFRDIGYLLNALEENYLTTNGMIAIAYGTNQLFAQILTPEIAKDINDGMSNLKNNLVASGGSDEVAELLRLYKKNKTPTGKLINMLESYMDGNSDLLKAMRAKSKDFPSRHLKARNDDDEKI